MIRVPFLLCLLLALSVCSGCVERSLRVETEPPGAELYVDGTYVGKTPAEIPFTFYGTREIRLYLHRENADGVIENFEPVVIHQQLIAPAYEWFPVDFVSENLVPFTFHDNHVLHVEMARRELRSLDEKNRLTEELEERANRIRAQLDED